MTSQTTEKPRTPAPRSQAEQQARRTIRNITRHLAHISRDAAPHILAQQHTQLGHAINTLATTKHQEQK